MKLKLIKLRKENKKNSETINLRGIGSDAIFKNILKAQLILETIDVKFLEVLKSLKTLKYCFKEIKENIYLIEFIENNEEDFQKNSIELLIFSLMLSRKINLKKSLVYINNKLFYSTFYFSKNQEEIENMILKDHLVIFDQINSVFNLSIEVKNYLEKISRRIIFHYNSELNTYQLVNDFNFFDEIYNLNTQIRKIV